MNLMAELVIERWKNNMTQRIYLHSVLLAAFALSGLLVSCGQTKQVRELPPEALEYIGKKITKYESSETESLFAAEKDRFRKLSNAFRGALNKKNHPRFTHDPRLDMVAYVNALAWGEEGTSPADSLKQWTLWKLGFAGRIDSSLSMTTWAQYGRTKERLTNYLREHAKKLKPEGERYSFGVARAHVGSEKWALSLVVIENVVAINEQPKHYKTGDILTLRGKVLVPHRNAWFNMQAAGPETLSMRFQPDEDGFFLIKAPVPSVPGRYFVELEVERKPYWAPSAVRFPIYVGVFEPETPDEYILNPPKNPPDRLEWGKLLLGLFNAQRQAYGIKPLKMSSQASRMASIQAQRRCSSCCKSEKPLRQKLREKGVQVDRSFQTGRFFDYMKESFWSRLTNPDFRETILDDRYRAFGSGFTQPPEDYRSNWYGVQYFYTPTPERRQFPEEVAAALGKPVNSYDDKTTDDLFPQSNPELIRLATEYTDAIRTATGAEIRYEPTLDVIALTYARWGTIDWFLVYHMLWKLGISGDVDRYHRRVTRDADISPYAVLEIENDIESEEEDKKRHYSLGISRVPLQDGWWLETLVVVKRDVVFQEPIRKNYAPGEEIIVKGQFTDEVRTPRLWMGVDGGKVKEWDIDAHKNGWFTIKVLAPDSPGKHMIEITSNPLSIDDDRKGILVSRRTECAMPIYVGQPEPTLADRLINPPGNPVDQTTWSTRIIGAYNDARRKAGAPPLKPHRLATVLAKDKQDQDEETFDAPTLSDVADALKVNNAGSMFSASISATKSIEALVGWNLMMPSKRATILDKDAMMFAANVNEDGDLYIEILLSAPILGDSTPKGRYKFSSLKMEQNWSGPKEGRISKKSARKPIAEGQGEIDECYTDNIDDDEKTRGTVAVDFAIGIDGRVIGAYMVSSTVENGELEKCIVNAVRKWSFPAPLGEGAAISSHTFKLDPSIRERKKSKKKK